MSTELPDVVSRYFERDGERDIESIVGLFAEDATVIDEGEERHGTAEIRAWQTGAASKYTYTTEITGAEALGPDRYLVTGRLTGNFPGGTADLKWDFSIAPAETSRGSSSLRRRTSGPVRDERLRSLSSRRVRVGGGGGGVERAAVVNEVAPRPLLLGHRRDYDRRWCYILAISSARLASNSAAVTRPLSRNCASFRS